MFEELVTTRPEYLTVSDEIAIWSKPIPQSMPAKIMIVWAIRGDTLTLVPCKWYWKLLSRVKAWLDV